MNDLITAVNKSSKKTVGGFGLVVPDPVRLPTGVFALDLASGGGFPKGRLGVIYGLEAAMKTTLLLKLIANHQKLYPEQKCAFIDVEHHMIQSWAERFGVNWDDLLYIRPGNGEQIVDLMEGLMQADDVGLIGLDSVAAMISQRELDAEAETANVGTSGLLINKLYRKMTFAFGEAAKHDIFPTVILINQIRYKMGVRYGNPEIMPGGAAILFVSSLSVRVSSTDEYVNKNDKLPSYKHVRAIIKKEKIPILSKNCEYSIALRDIEELNLKFGDSYDWKTVLLYLKKLGMLIQGKTGWDLKVQGHPVKNYATQDQLKSEYQADFKFSATLRKCIIEKAMVDGDPIKESDTEKEEDEDSD